MESNLKQEAMDIAYVRYEPIQDPYHNSSVHPSRGSNYRPHTAYTGGTHYVETVHYDDYEGRSVVYEEVPNSPQQGHWRSGNWKPSSKNYNQEYYEESDYYIPDTKSFQTKSFTKSNIGVAAAESSSSYSNTRSTKPYNTPNTSTVSSYGYEDRSPKIASKPLQVKIVNPRPEFNKGKNFPAQTAQQQKVHILPPKAQTVSRNPLPQQMTVVSNSLGGAKRNASALQYAYQNSFVGSGASRKFQQDSNEGIDQNGGDGKPSKWKGPGTASGGIKKRKKTPAEKHLRLKKYVQPKNALMCLNELMQGLPLKFEQEGTSTLGAPICMTIEVNGQKYKGFGSSKLSAKQAAAEAALVSFVKPPPPSEEDDKTPWGVLASFAMFKLFNEWKEGRIGMNSSTAPAASFGAPMVPDPTSAATLQSMLSKSLGEMEVKAGAGQVDPKTNLMTSVAGEKKKISPSKSGPSQNSSPEESAAKKMKTSDDGSKFVPTPQKALPENAASVHPVMLLHQMRPSLTYEQFCLMKGEQREFTLKCVIDGQTFQGNGANVKKAKYDLAVKANRQLFNVVTVYVPTAN